MKKFEDIFNWKIFKYIEQKLWIPISEKPNSATDIDWRKWDNIIKQKYPIRYWIFEEFPLIWHDKFEWTSDIYWWFQYRFNPKHQYHKITFAKPGYLDTDYQILFAVCELVSKFVEFQESEYSHVNWGYTKKHQEAFNIMKEIRDYWRIEYPNRDKDYPKYPNKDKFDLCEINNRTEQEQINFEFWCSCHNIIEKKHENRENEILRKAISVRKFMWD